MSSRKKNVLIITSSGGGGCLQLAMAKKQQLMQKEPLSNIMIIDVMKKWTWFGMGRLFVLFYNTTQTFGKARFQERLVGCQAIAELMLWLPIFFKSLRTFFKNDIDRLIDTQALCPSAIINALRIYNHRRRKNVIFEKVLVDLPTYKSTHLFHNIRRMSSKNRSLVRLLTIEPLLDTPTEEMFWQKHCKIGLSQIQKEDFYVRDAFSKYFHQKRPSTDMQLFIRADASRRALLRNVVSKSKARKIETKEGFSFSISPNDHVMVILLGSQAAQKATFDYVQNFLYSMKKITHPDRFYHLFVFCPNRKRDVMQEIYDLVNKEEKYPSHFTIIPMEFQSEDVIASLFFRSDVSITRTGGQTAMELMGVSKGRIWIHSETKDKHMMDVKKLLKGIPGWESGNAEYLMEKYSARIVTPTLVLSLAEEFV